MVRYMHREKFFAAHRAEDTVLIADVIRQQRPAVVVELGTHHGGLAALFAEVVGEWGGVVHTFDNVRHFAGNELLDTYPNLTFHLESVLDRNDRVVSLLRPGVVLYCDNGHKERELELYAPAMPVGALLGCHDYGSEVRPEFVEPMVHRLGFDPHRREEFEALATPDTYPVSMTRFWRRVRLDRPRRRKKIG